MERKIGERQRWAWQLSAVSAVAASVVCSYSWPWVLVGSLVVAVYGIILERFVPSNGIAGAMDALGWAGKGLIVLTILWNVTVMGWAANLADTAFPMVDGFPVLGWVLLAAAAWGSWKGAAACARCCGVLSLFLLFLYGIIVIFSVPDLQWNNLKPVGNWRDSLWTAGLLLMASGVWYVPCDRRKKAQTWELAILLPLFAAVLAIITAGILSPSLVATSQAPLYEVAQSVSLFGVIERIESLLSAAMTMGVFALLSTMAAACQFMGNQLMQWRCHGIVCCFAAWGTMYLARYLTVEFLTIGAGLIWVALPLLVVVFGRSHRPHL